MLERLEELRENIFRYLEARIELFTLETRGKLEETAVAAVHAIVLGFLAVITTIFLFSLLAAYLNKVFDSRYMGFLIVAGFFLVLTVIWALAKNGMQSWIRHMAYNAMKSSQDKKAEERSQAVRDLMNQTTETLTKNNRSIAQESGQPRP